MCILFVQKEKNSTSLFAVAVGINQKGLVHKMVKMVDADSFDLYNILFLVLIFWNLIALYFLLYSSYLAVLS